MNIYASLSRISSRASNRKPRSAARTPQPAPRVQPFVLDPEIYATGKRRVTADEIYAEGLYAIDSNHASRRSFDHEVDPDLMLEGETRTIIDEQSRWRPDYRLLVRLLTNWLNDELAPERIIVRDLLDDLYDGQVLCKLIEKKQKLNLDLIEVTQSELIQRRKLKAVLDVVNNLMYTIARSWARIEWSVNGIHSKNIVEILRLLVALALFYEAPVRLPANVLVRVLIFEKRGDELRHRLQQVKLTDEFVLDGFNSPPRGLQLKIFTRALCLSQAHLNNSKNRDSFDVLVECAPEKLLIVKQSLARFCNRHLSRINMSCGPSNDLRPENFSDGLLLVLLISSLEDYFVPLGELFTSARIAPTPMYDETATSRRFRNTLVAGRESPLIDSNPTAPIDDALSSRSARIGRPTAIEPYSYTCSLPIEKLHNVNIALQLMEEAGLADIRRRVRPEQIVNGDLKATLRVLYAIFGHYKHL